MWFLDSGFIVFVIPAMIFAFYAQAKVKGAYQRYSRLRSRSGLTGAQVARMLLEGARLDEIKVTQTRGQLTDHYDSREKVVRLSPEVYRGDSLASIGIAAHEVGHAIQHGTDYFALNIRNAIVPLAGFGSQAAFPLFLVGLIFQQGFLMDIGIAIFLFAVFFQAITLPVELNASKRAMALLEGGGMLQGEELSGARKVLNAAALTYIAALAMALAQLLRLLLLRGRN